MGEHMRLECPLDAPGGSAEMSSALRDSRLLGYRAAVDDLAKEAGRHRGSSDLPAAEGLVARRLGQPEFTAVLSSLDGGVDVAAARLIREIRNYRPSVRSSASDLPALVRIFLLSQIDSAAEFSLCWLRMRSRNALVSPVRPGQPASPASV
jgi:hypothetical protein